MSDNYSKSEFNIEGQFLGLISDKSEKFKYLQLALESGNVQIKLPKELRLLVSLSLVPGEQIRVSGVKKLNFHTGEIKLKAYEVTQLGVCLNQKMPLQQGTLSPELLQGNGSPTPLALTNETPAPKSPPKAKILMCQKSGCLKRGGKSLLLELEKTLYEHGLQDQVVIEYTGCFKCCKSAPNYTLVIGTKEYKKIHPEAIASLLKSHLS